MSMPKTLITHHMNHLIFIMHIIIHSNKLMINKKIIIYIRNDPILGIGLIIEGILNTLKIKAINFHLGVFFCDV